MMRGTAIPVIVHFRPKISMRNPEAKHPAIHPSVAREAIQLPSLAAGSGHRSRKTADLGSPAPSVAPVVTVISVESSAISPSAQI